MGKPNHKVDGKGASSNGNHEFTYDWESLKLPFDSTKKLISRSSLKNLPESSSKKLKTKRFALAPVSWLEAAAKLPPSAMIVGIFIWFYYGMNKRKPVSFSPVKGRTHGLSRIQVRRGVKYLEEAGLLEVIRQPYKAVLVRPIWEHLENLEL